MQFRTRARSARRTRPFRPTPTTASRRRARVENFPISGLRAPADLVDATVLIKKAAAQANVALGRLDARVGDAIVRAADEVLGGALARPVRRRRLPGRRRHVAQHERQRGAGQPRRRAARRRARRVPRSCIPTITSTWASRRTTCSRPRRGWRCCLAHRRLVDAARALAASLATKADEFDVVLKVGRTHLQDAVPMTLGQEFGGYAACIARGADDVEHAAEQLRGAESRRDRRRHRTQRRRRLHDARDRQPAAR